MELKEQERSVDIPAEEAKFSDALIAITIALVLAVPALAQEEIPRRGGNTTEAL